MHSVLARSLLLRGTSVSPVRVGQRGQARRLSYELGRTSGTRAIGRSRLAQRLAAAIASDALLESWLQFLTCQSECLLGKLDGLVELAGLGMGGGERVEKGGVLEAGGLTSPRRQGHGLLAVTERGF